MAALHIGAMNRAELDIALEWAAAEGWNPGLHDGDPFFAADPGGFLLGRIDGRPVATLSAVRYGEGFGFVGLYIVHPAFRGRGLGRELWQAGMERLAGRNIGLDGVLAQQQAYRRSGFVLAHRNVRYAGRCGEVAAALAEPRADGGALSLSGLSTLPFAALRDYDRAFFPDDRDAFLRAWTTQPDALGYAARERGALAGYALARRCRDGYKVGPLYADGGHPARALLHAIAAGLPVAAPIFIDVPSCNPEAVALALGCGMREAFETARMYTGRAPDISLERTYGITTFELG